jgi:hypothetical protein
VFFVSLGGGTAKKEDKMESDNDKLESIFHATKLLARLAGGVMNASHTAETRRLENAFRLRVQAAGAHLESFPVPEDERPFLRVHLHWRAERDGWIAVLTPEEIDFLINFLVESQPDSFIAACEGAWSKKWIESGGWNA